MRSWADFFDTKWFAMLVVGGLGLLTFHGCIENPRLLFFPALAVVLYWVAFKKTAT
jgi:hypothetical protein